MSSGMTRLSATRIVATVLLILGVLGLSRLVGRTDVLLLVALSPLIVVVGGKVVEWIIERLEELSTVPLFFAEFRSFLVLTCYYASFSAFLAFLIDNSVLLSSVNATADEGEVALVSLGLVFLPRVLSYASGFERTRNIFITILTPLTLAAAFIVFQNPSGVLLRWQSIQVCLLGSPLLTVFGDLTLYSASFLGFVRPRMTLHTIQVISLRRMIDSQLETLNWNDICDILTEARQVNRIDIVLKITESMTYFVQKSRSRGANLARVRFVDALTNTLYKSVQLSQELLPVYDALKKDSDPEVRGRTAYGFGLASNAVPAALQRFAELINERNNIALGHVSEALVRTMKTNAQAVSYAIQLSVNPVLLDEVETMGIEEKTPAVSFYTRQVLAVWVLEAAYAKSPDIVIAHIERCSASPEARLRFLAAAVLSNPYLLKDARLQRIHNKLKKDKRTAEYLGSYAFFHSFEWNYRAKNE
jgi:hypothetical protein